MLVLFMQTAIDDELVSNTVYPSAIERREAGRDFGGIHLEPLLIPVALADDLGEARIVAAEMSGRSLGVACEDGNYWVFGRKCPHEDAVLVTGAIEDATLAWPNHGYVFDLEASGCLIPVGCPPLVLLEAVVRDGAVCVRVDPAV